VTATRILDKINKTKQTEDDSSKKRAGDEEDLKKEGKRLKIFSEDVTGVKYNTGKAASSFTSTAVEATNENEAREATEDELLQSMFSVMRRRKKKGYVRIETNMGNLLVEIHCDMVPRTATNFIKLCDTKKYKGVTFHRLIKSFMIQGGKPPKDSSDKDESIWGGAFKDEFDNRLKHDGKNISVITIFVCLCLFCCLCLI
jgi:peptidyl-prolyl cis-trans isomerase-like protein 2